VGYPVTTPVFEGPIDLLLHLVSSHEIDVLEIPLAPVVDAFVAMLVAQRDELTMDMLSEFLLVAAILVELKSQRLLPGQGSVEDDDELIGWEERDLLLARLLECRAYAGAADVFVGLIETAARSIPREVGLEEGVVVHAPDLLAGITPDKLAQAYLKGTAERPVPRVDLSHVTVDTVTVSEAVEGLVALLPGSGLRSFRELTEHFVTRIEVIVRFLALLELCKLGKVSIGQGDTFGDLQIEWIADDRELVGIGSGLLGIDDYEG
jgi:segregation and condensation protein A